MIVRIIDWISQIVVVMFVILGIIYALSFFQGCSKFYKYGEDELELQNIPGRCVKSAKLHWNRPMGVSRFNIYGGCTDCPDHMLENGTCDLGLHFLGSTADLSWEQKTSHRECSAYRFMIKSIKNEHESDFSNQVRCVTSLLDPLMPAPVVRGVQRSWSEHDGLEYRTDETENRGFEWDASDGAEWYEFGVVRDDDPLHLTVHELGDTTNTEIYVDLPLTPGHYYARVRACAESADPQCSDWAVSNDSAYGQVCVEGVCSEKAWWLYIKLAPPTLTIE